MSFESSEKDILEFYNNLKDFKAKTLVNYDSDKGVASVVKHEGILILAHFLKNA